mmetsp:Transcript_9175/g.55703  ORF Transcript_9175/g.55703 Transcript_9175/m.55703 type:complete len:200 (-) Transcript_9175:526-1125(-)
MRRLQSHAVSFGRLWGRIQLRPPRLGDVGGGWFHGCPHSFCKNVLVLGQIRHKQRVVCPSRVGSEPFDERLLHFRVYFGREGLGFDLRGVELLCQLPDMRVDRDGLVLVQRKEADACGHLHAHPRKGAERLLCLAVLCLAQALQPLLTTFLFFVEGTHRAGDESGTISEPQLSQLLLRGLGELLQAGKCVVWFFSEILL